MRFCLKCSPPPCKEYDELCLKICIYCEFCRKMSPIVPLRVSKCCLFFTMFCLNLSSRRVTWELFVTWNVLHRQTCYTRRSMFHFTKFDRNTEIVSSSKLRLTRLLFFYALILYIPFHFHLNAHLNLHLLLIRDRVA